MTRTLLGALRVTWLGALSACPALSRVQPDGCQRRLRTSPAGGAAEICVSRQFIWRTCRLRRRLTPRNRHPCLPTLHQPQRLPSPTCASRQACDVRCRGALTMNSANLPFTRDQFLGMFETYNRAIWPAQVLAYVLGVSAVALVIWRTRASDRLI